ncbi:MAG: cysteine synthase family protein [candidate division Zixibacteria bacterium]|jgi:cystathionine beta-synthase|nr:cysteine synthase family protein [candidate division Zixibacteria bacterium]
MTKKFYVDDITQTVGETPLVRIRKMTADRGIRATVLVKPEYLNPTGSVKDRMAIYILNEAVKSGTLKPGGTIIEATSGNTGAAVAMFAAAHDYKAVLTIPDKMSKEKVDALKAFGAEVHVCPTAVPPDDPNSYYETAKRIAQSRPDVFMLNQYHNLDNIKAHYMTTGPEIWRQTAGRIDCFVAGVGTGGTMSGTAKFLKEQNPACEVVAVDVEGSVYYDYFKTRRMPEAHPYLVEGIGDDMLCEALDFSVIDEMYQANDKISFVFGRELARREGILAGGSAGAAVWAALEHAKKLDSGKTMVVILPDAGAKYISKMYNDDWMREKGFLD